MELRGRALNNDLFIESRFEGSTGDVGDTGGERGGHLLTLRAQIHCQPQTLKDFLMEGPKMKFKKDKAVKSGEGDVYDMTYRVTTRAARCEVQQELSWGDGSAIHSDSNAEFILVASAKEDDGVVAAPGSLVGGVGSVRGNQRRKRDAVKEAAKGVIKRAVTKEKGDEDKAGESFRVVRVALTSVTELFAAPHGTTETRVTCRMEGASISEKDAKEGRCKGWGGPLPPPPPYPFLSPLPPLHNTVLKRLYFDPLKDALAKFDRSEEVDEAVRNVFADAARNDDIPSLRAAEESRMIQEAMDYVDAGNEEGEQWKRIGASLSKPVEKFKRKSKGESIVAAWGMATAIIHASSELVLAWTWIADSDERKKLHVRENGDLIRRVKYLPNSRTQYTDIGFDFPSTNRLFSLTSVWGKASSGDGGELFVVAGKTRDLEKDEFDIIERDFGKFIKATIKQVILIEGIAPHVCRVTYAAQVDVGGRIPTALMDTQISFALDIVKNMHERFERRGKDVDAEVRDGLFFVGEKEGVEDKGRCGDSRRW